MTAQDAFIDGLHNADAMEKQALSIMQPPLNRLEHYPEVSALLDRRIRETEDQITRLDDVLDSVGASASAVNDVGLSFAGTMTSVGHIVASDEIPAWLSWALIHVYLLVGFQNRVLVCAQWLWRHMTCERGARLIAGDDAPNRPAPPIPADGDLP